MLKRSLSVVLFLLVAIISTAGSYGDIKKDAESGESQQFGIFIGSANAYDIAVKKSERYEPSELSGIIDQISEKAKRDPIDELIRRFPIVTKEEIEEFLYLDEQGTIERLNPKSGEMNEERVLAAVIARSPKLQAMRYEWKASLNRYPQEYYLQDLLNQFTAFSGGMKIETGKEFQNPMVQMSTGNPGMLGLRGEIAKLDIETAWLDYVMTGIEVVTDTRKVLAEIRQNDTMIEIQSSYLSKMSALAEITQVQYVAGTKSFSDLLRIRTEVASAEDSLSRSRKMESGLNAMLNGLINLSPDTKIAKIVFKDDTIGEIKIAQAIEQVSESNPELLMMSAEIKKMDAMISMSMLNADSDSTFGFSFFSPDFMSGFSAGESGSGMTSEKMIPEIPKTGESMGGMDLGSMNSGGMTADKGESEMEMTGSGFMQSPMVDYRENTFALNSAWALELVDKRDGMKSMLSDEISMKKSEISDKYQSYLSAKNSIEISKSRVIPNAKSAVEITRTGYVADENSFNDLIMAEFGLLDALMNLANYEYESSIALFEIEKTAGFLSGVEMKTNEDER